MRSIVRRAWRAFERCGPHLRTLAVAWVGMVLAVVLLGRATVSIDAFRVELAASFGPAGVTRVELPPFGEVRARTHRGPLTLTVTLADVDLDLLRAMIERDTRSDVLPQIERQLRYSGERFLVWVVLLGGAGGAAGTVLLRRRSWRRAVAGAAFGLLSMAGVVGWSYATFDARAFRSPEFEGAVKAAPWVIDLVGESVTQARKLSRQMTLIASNLYQLFGAIDTLTPLGERGDQVVAMLVTDVHNNPVGVDFIRRMVLAFRPDFVLDTGDLTDYGTALEGSLLAELGQLPVPYVIVPGNHDSPEELAELGSLPNVIVLRNGEITVHDVPIVGEADPASARLSPALGTPEEIAMERDAVDADLRAAPQPPAILAVHNPQVALRFLGRAPVIVAGHTHRVDLRRGSASVYLNPGTTGAAGIRGLASTQAIPYSLMILYLDRTPDGLAPRAVDVVEVTSVSGTVTLQRHLFAVPSGAGAPATTWVDPGADAQQDP